MIYRRKSEPHRSFNHQLEETCAVASSLELNSNARPMPAFSERVAKNCSGLLSLPRLLAFLGMYAT